VSGPRGNISDTVRQRMAGEFLRQSREDLARMRGLLPDLGNGDGEAWARSCTLAHNIAAGANIHKLGVLTACARELDKLLCERAGDGRPDAFLMSCVASAIEAVALEVEERLREG
jgi:hypothetical protein